ncbi:MAG TPA: prepilin peptidase [Janthinobacterium sp.]|nr:prepilin peptidase [Janthinobacterium sp.]
MFILPPLETTLICFVTLAAISDLAWRRISNVLILSGLCCALALHLLHAPAAVPAVWLGGALSGFFAFLPLYLLRGMAAGDVKLMAMAGAFLGPCPALQAAAASVLIGGAMGLAIVIYRGRLRQALGNVAFLLTPLLWRAAGAPLKRVTLAPGASVGGMPYGLAIALGCLWLVLKR